jgi:hypothetical protein
MKADAVPPYQHGTVVATVAMVSSALGQIGWVPTD